MKFIGYDKLFRKAPSKEIKFDIRFHLVPETKVMKTKLRLQRLKKEEIKE